MENIDLEKMFSQENVNKYRNYFDLPKVINQANKIIDAVSNTKELTNDENMASLILAVLRLNQSQS